MLMLYGNHLLQHTEDLSWGAFSPIVGKMRKRNSWFCSMDDHSEWMCRQKLHVTKQGKPNDPNGNMCSCSCGSVCPQRLLARPMRIAKKLVMMILSGEVPTKPQLSAPKGVLPSAWMVHVSPSRLFPLVTLAPKPSWAMAPRHWGLSEIPQVFQRCTSKCPPPLTMAYWARDLHGSSWWC